MIGVGEQTGAMDAMVCKRSPTFTRTEVDAAVKDLLAAMEPMMIVFFGPASLAAIVISMYLPPVLAVGQLSQAH